MIITPQAIASTPFAQAIPQAIEAAIASVQPGRLVANTLRREGDVLFVGQDAYALSTYKRISIVAMGKAAVPMLLAAHPSLQDVAHQSILVSGKSYVGTSVADLPSSTHVFLSSHPVPDETSVAAGEAIIDMAQSLGADDLLLVLLSGGASALCILPAPGISLKEMQQTTSLLLKAGADIHELNCVRKHLSAFKGGLIAQAAAPAQVAALVLSDVIGDPLDVIGSGPTAPDDTSYQDALSVVEKYRLEVPLSVRDHLQLGINQSIQDTPGSNDPLFDRVSNTIIGNNRTAVQATAKAFEERGMQVLIMPEPIVGEAKEAGKMLAKFAADLRSKRKKTSGPLCAVFGGETTVTVTGVGKGGRNTELALSAAQVIEGFHCTIIGSFGTDGADGPTDAAGALATGHTVRRAHELGLSAQDFLENNDSYSFFHQLGDLIVTGPTQTNVADVMFVCIL